MSIELLIQQGDDNVKESRREEQHSQLHLVVADFIYGEAIEAEESSRRDFAQCELEQKPALEAGKLSDSVLAELYCKRGNVDLMLNKNNPQNAIDHARTALKLDANCADAYHLLARALRSIGCLDIPYIDLGTAVSNIDTAISINGKNLLYHAHKGMMLHELGKTEEAKKHYLFALGQHRKRDISNWKENDYHAALTAKYCLHLLGADVPSADYAKSALSWGEMSEYEVGSLAVSLKEFEEELRKAEVSKKL
ncbi:MAG TPA: hypothetical protein VJI75_04380 [Candidatus Nanoarchaeia archaeon]|nr:hypothetical protein [Candidatus Nanoarchaeia archaeon]